MTFNDIDFKNPILNNANILKIGYNKKENEAIIYINLENFVEPSFLKNFIKTIKEMKSDIKEIKKLTPNISFNNKKLSQKIVEDLYEIALYFAIEENQLCKVFSSFKTKFSNKTKTLSILVASDETKLDQYLDCVKKEFSMFNIDVNLKIEVDHTLRKRQEIQEEKHRKLAEISHKQFISVMENIRASEVRSYKFSTNNKSQAVKIKDIPLDNLELTRYIETVGPAYFTVEGEIIKLEIRKLKSFHLLEIILADSQTDAIICKRFIRTQKDLIEANSLKVGDFIKVEGNCEYDEYAKDITIIFKKFWLINKPAKNKRKDLSKIKRVELSAHTKMSVMDSPVSVDEYFSLCESFGHKAIAFTDVNNVYAYNEIYNKKDKYNVKPIYGININYCDNEEFKIAYGNPKNDINLTDATYVVFDLETTGFSPTNDKITEIGAVKIKNGLIVDEFQTFVNPQIKLTDKVIELTNITDEMVKNAPHISEVLPKFLKFIGDSILVAHNASFDIKHILKAMDNLKLKKKDFKVIDTLNLSRHFLRDKISRFGLKYITKYYKVKLEDHHRAINDARATAECFLVMLSRFKKRNIITFTDLNKTIDINEDFKYTIPSKINILVKEQKGLKNLYYLLSRALTTNFLGEARLTKTDLQSNREGLLVGSGGYNGLLFEIALNGLDSELENIISLYDYIEVQPPKAYKHLFDNWVVGGEDIIKATITKIINYARGKNKIVVATSNPFYLNKEDQILRNIYVNAPKVGGGIHELRKFSKQPETYFLNTEEMLKEFDFLDEDLAYEIVVTNTNKIANQISDIKVFPDKLLTFEDDSFKDLLGIESLSSELTKLVEKSLKKTYGNNIHPYIKNRVNKELKSIIGNNYASIYYLSYLLVKQSNEDGYIVGSRGSVGSSFIATLLNITEVNPLRPHYLCPNHDFFCLKYGDTDKDIYKISKEEEKFQKYFKNIEAGVDLPDCKCPHCGSKLIKAGSDIPFETFLGFRGDKVPDIDLNMSGLYQDKSHEMVRKLLGEDYSYRAGTITTLATKNAYGTVSSYYEDKNIKTRRAQVIRLSDKIQGSARTTSKHAGGIVVVPRDYDILDVTPYQYPAGDKDSDWKTTHFDYHAYEDNLLKLDLLGHDNPTIIRYLMDFVDENPKDFPFKSSNDIPIDDPKIYELFRGTKVLGVSPKQILTDVATYGVPEFGTEFVRGMLKEVRPNKFSEVVKISGLSHGTDVWLGNGQALMNGIFKGAPNKIAFNDIIACRDDIMITLINKYGVEPYDAFIIMEFVRKGKPSKQPDQWSEYAKIMAKHNVPKWYINSCELIQYLFPKAHATAYVTMALKIAWFKIYKPELFYSSFFSFRAKQFDYEVMVNGTNAIFNKLSELRRKNYLKNTEQELMITLEVALEASQRGIKFLPIDIEKSESEIFKVESKKEIRMPFKSIPGLGDKKAMDILKAREEQSFTSKEDFKKRSKVSKTVFQHLIDFGAFTKLDKVSKNEEKDKELGIFKFNFK